MEIVSVCLQAVRNYLVYEFNALTMPGEKKKRKLLSGQKRLCFGRQAGITLGPQPNAAATKSDSDRIVDNEQETYEQSNQVTG